MAVKYKYGNWKSCKSMVLQYINFVHERQYMKFVVGSFVCSPEPLDSKYRFVTIKL